MRRLLLSESERSGTDDVGDHHADGDHEDRGPDHVDLRRRRDARRAPDEERERGRRARVEVRDHEVVDREREREQRRRR